MNILCIFACVLGILSLTAADSICKADLGLVVDTTKSLNDGSDVLSFLKTALANLVQKFDISVDKTHVSLETFGGKDGANVHNNFNERRYWSNDAIDRLINTTINKLSSPTRLDLALRAAANNMFTEAKGDRPGEVSALVLFTDGRTSDNTNKIELNKTIDDLKDKGVLLIAVAIGPDSSRPGSQKNLKQIGGEKLIELPYDMSKIGEKMDEVVNYVCVCKPNLGLVVDTTKSLQRGNPDVTVLRVLKEALAHFVQKFDISEDKTRVSLETFDGQATLHNKFNDNSSWSVNHVISLINGSITKLRSPTRLDFALKKANGSMFTEANGYRPGELNALVVLTDGKTNDNTNNDELNKAIKDLEDKGVRLIAVGIGKDSEKMGSQARLKKIAGDHVLYNRNYVGLDNTMDTVFNLICGLPRTGQTSAIA